MTKFKLQKIKKLLILTNNINSNTIKHTSCTFLLTTEAISYKYKVSLTMPSPSIMRVICLMIVITEIANLTQEFNSDPHSTWRLLLLSIFELVNCNLETVIHTGNFCEILLSAPQIFCEAEVLCTKQDFSSSGTRSRNLSSRIKNSAVNTNDMYANQFSTLRNKIFSYYISKFL